jgi:hypothetical protein
MGKLNACNFLVGKPEGKRLFVRVRERIILKWILKKQKGRGLKSVDSD